MSGRRDLFLNLTTAGVTLCAVAVGGVRVKQHLFPPSVGTFGTKVVKEWRDYAQSGQRMGSRSAPVTIVEFGDFQCPACRRAAVALREIRKKHPKDVAVVFRHLPLPNHDHSLAAARVSECAALFGRFEEYHDALFEKADSIGRISWSAFAETAGITDSERFETCASDTAPVSAIARDTTAAQRLGVQGTPVFLINELLVSGFPGSVVLEEHVRQALKRASGSQE